MIVSRFYEDLSELYHKTLVLKSVSFVHITAYYVYRQNLHKYIKLV